MREEEEGKILQHKTLIIWQAAGEGSAGLCLSCARPCSRLDVRVTLKAARGVCVCGPGRTGPDQDSVHGIKRNGEAPDPELKRR